MGHAFEVSTRVRRIIAERLDVPESYVRPYSTFVDDLGADSMSLVELVMAFEDAFEIDIPEADAARIRTVQDALDYVGRQVESGSRTMRACDVS
jgi:acyl carrier protein